MTHSLLKRKKRKSSDIVCGKTTIIHQLVKPPLVAITLSNRFLYNVISLTEEWRNFGPLSLTTLFQFIEVCRHSFMKSSFKVLLQHFNHFEVSYSHVDLLVPLGSLSCCMSQFGPSFSCCTYSLTFNPTILCYTEEFMVNSMTVGFPDTVAKKQAQIISLPPPCFKTGMRCLY